MNINIEQIIKHLRERRPIFHSEADFQHALAWEIHCRHPSARIRLEINKGSAGQREYVDIWATDNETNLAIELKYKTAKFDSVYDGEEFHLTNHGAQDIGRYDFIKDIGRLERFVKFHANTIGYAILLTNDIGYWKATKRLMTADAGFRIHESRVLSGELGWNDRAGPGTMKGRENPLLLSGAHSIAWADYKDIPGKGPGMFRYVLLEINRSPISQT